MPRLGRAYAAHPRTAWRPVLATVIPLLSGLTCYWKLDESAGTRNDSVGTNHLTDVNTVGSAVGKIGAAASFVSASSEYFTLTSNANVSIAGDFPFTITAWVNATTLVGSHRRIVSKNLEVSFATMEYDLWWDKDASSGAGRFMFAATNGTTYQQVAANGFGAATTGVWYFLCAWHDPVANTINISVNNGAADSAAFSVGVNSVPTTPFRIGANGNGGSLWNGLIDEVGLWKRVLTVDERTQLYNDGVGWVYGTMPAPIPFPYSPRAWWKADSLALTDGAAIASWPASGSSGLTLTQATGTAQPTYKTNILNGRPVVRFDGGDRMTVPDTLIPTVLEIFVVVIPRSLAAIGTVSMMTDGGGGWANGLQINTTPKYRAYFWDGGVKEVFSTTSAAVDTPALVTIMGANGSAPTISLAGTVEATGGAAIGTLWAGQNTIQLGAGGSSGTDPLNGDIAEILIYDRVLTTTQRDDIEALLYAKYFVTPTTFAAGVMAA